MRTSTKDEQTKILGEGSFWFPNKAPGSLFYLHGAEGFDEMHTDAFVESPFNLSLRPNGLAISIMHRLKLCYLAVPYSQLRSVGLETPADIFTKKEKSVIGRAVLGGVLLGPVGALVGGMSGSKDSVDAEKQDALLTIAVEENGRLTYVVATIASGLMVTALRQWLQKNLAAYCQA